MEEINKKYTDDQFVKTRSWKEFVNSLEKPRKIIMMIKAGRPVDETIHHLQPFLDEGDILIDGGNSYFKDTNRRFKELANNHIHFIGMDVSGGELGALNGPSLMFGGDKETYQVLAPVLEKIAAKTKDQVPCVGYVGPQGAGHYVKMVHNGIEYGIMQIICETYDFIRKFLGWSNKQMADLFEIWNRGELQGYLIAITSDVLRKKDELTRKDVVDVVLNKASYKGTGNWMLEDAIKLGAPISVIAEAVFARFLSDAVLNDEVYANGNGKAELFSGSISMIENAIYLAQTVSFDQEFQQLRFASDEYNWQLDLASVAQVWEAGCIIRSRSLGDIRIAFLNMPSLDNLFLAPFFKKLRKSKLKDLRQFVQIAERNRIPTPSMSAALNYLDSIFNSSLPANLLQAQRDYFGAHTFRRNDRSGTFHEQWYEEA